MIRARTMLYPVLGALVSVTVASATQAWGAVNVQGYEPPLNSTYTLTEDAMLQVEPGDPVWTGRRLYFSATYSWVNDPLVIMNSTRTQQVGVLVNGIHTLDLGASWVLNRHLTLNVGVPLNLVQMPGLANQFALGDSRVFLKYRITPDNAILHVALIPELWMPTGAQDLFVSNGMGAGLRAAFEHDFGPIRAAANIGYEYFPNSSYLGLSYSQMLPMALGVYVPVSRDWGMNAEASGAISLPLNRYSNPGQAYLGARYDVARNASITGGLSVGSLGGNGASDFRAIVGLRFTPMADPAPAVHIAVAPPKKPVHVAKVARVIFTRHEIKITEEVRFQHAKAVLTHSGKNLLDEVAEVIKQNRKRCRRIIIEGYTNELGGALYNQILSEQRAGAVKDYLISRGVPDRLLGSIGYGKSRLKYLPGLPREVQLEANRRVAFKVLN